MAKPNGILRLLLIDDSLTTADVISTTLRISGYTVRAARYDTMDELKEALAEKPWDLIICRDTLATIPPKEFLQYLKKLDCDIPCIILTSNGEDMDDLYDLEPQDVIAYSETRRLQFAVTREMKNLFIRRLSRRDEHAVHESEKRSRLLLDSSRDAVAYVHEGMHIYANQSYVNLFGYDTSEDLDDLPILDILVHTEHQKFKSFFRTFAESAGTDAQVIYAACIDANNRSFNAELEFRHTAVKGDDCIQVTVRDQTEEKNAVSEEQTLMMRDYDALTGLYSRARFMDELDKVAIEAGEGKGVSELLYIELDDFHSIKDRAGLVASETIIKTVAELLEKELVAGEFIARYSEQVFTVIISNGDEKNADQRAEHYRKVVESYTSQTDGKILELKCSIGISQMTENVSTTAGLDNADKARIEAQRAGGNRISRHQIVVPEKEAESQKKTLWVGRIQDALKNNNFILHYQPIASLHGATQELYNVVIRMKDADGGIIKANEFIKYAQKDQLIIDIDQWVIENALINLAEHRKSSPKTKFFLKLSKQTILNTGFIDWLFTRLKSHGFNGRVLVFGISAAAIIDNLEETQAVIAKLKKIGCEFGLDHFGSGLDFSHILSVLDVDYLKINGLVVGNTAEDKKNKAAVKAIVDMAKQAGKRSVAESVSDANSLALLWRLGVDYASGYYIQKPSKDLNYNFDDDE